MYIILVYNVNKRRVSKVMKICRKYLHHVQNSVFKENISVSQLDKLKKQLKAVIDTNEDKISIYHIGSLKYVRKEEIGKAKIISNIII